MAGPSAAAEWRANWAMVLAAIAGTSVSSLAIYTTGLFMQPMTAEFGWGRADFSFGLTIYAILLVPFAPVAGMMLDRFGSRRIAIAGVILFPALFACLSLATASLPMWWGLWVLLGIAAPFVSTAIWTRAVSSRFVAGRGLALAATLCGTSLSQIVAPQLVNWMITGFGWRTAFLGVGIGWGGVALALVTLFFYGARDLAQATPDADAAPVVEPGGLTLGEALTSVRVWRIALTELFSATIIVAMIIHFVPVLTDASVDRSVAVGLASVVGFSAIAGKLLTGFLLDRSQSNWIPTLTLWLPAVACLMLLEAAALGAWVIVPTIVFGYAVGGYYQTVTYLSTRYVGLRNFGKIFGLMTSLMGIGTGVGPWIAGAIFDRTGSYQAWLIAAAVISGIAGLLVFRLGAYPIWENETGEAPKPG